MITRTFIAAFFAALTAQATIIPDLSFTDIVDPSQAPGFINRRGDVFGASFQSSLNGTEVAGQNVELNILFNGFFVRAFTVNEKHHSFAPDLYLPYLPFWPGVTPPPGSPTLTGTATLLDALGQPIGSATPLLAFQDGGPTFEPDIQVFFVPDFSSTPVDIYGIRYDFQLSDSPGRVFANAPRNDFLYLGGFIGVGPGKIPSNIVPENTGSAVLFFLGMAGLCAYRRVTT